MADVGVNLRDFLDRFEPAGSIHHSLFLTYAFDGPAFEDKLVDLLHGRRCANVLVVMDPSQGALVRPSRWRSYRVGRANQRHQVYHPKLCLLVGDSSLGLVVGSGNLTRGGLESNMELMNAFELSQERGGPKTLFEQVLEYVQQHVRSELVGNSPRIAAALEELVSDGHCVLHGCRNRRTLVAQARFVHNQEHTLWHQLMEEVHGSLDAAAVISPFFEAYRPGEGGDPSNVEKEPTDSPHDASTVEALLSVLPDEGREPVCRFYVETTDAGKTLLPLAAVRSHADKVAVFAKDSTSADPRRLHAKAIALHGSAGGRDELVLYYGSANFTPSALLRRPGEGGNAETGIICRLVGDSATLPLVEEQLGLGELFSHRPLEDMEQADLDPAVEPAVRLIGASAEYDTQGGTLSVWVRVQGQEPEVLRIVGWIDGQPIVLANLNDWSGMPIVLRDEWQCLAAGGDRGMLRRLRLTRVVLEALSASGQVLARADAAMNVVAPEAFVEDVARSDGAAALDLDIYRAGLGLGTKYEDVKRILERLRSDHARVDDANSPVAPQHQADLDVFFRHVQQGLAGCRKRLEQGGARSLVLKRHLLTLSGWLGRASAEDGEGDGSFMGEQRLYLVGRLLDELREGLGLDRAGALPRHVRQEIAARIRDSLGKCRSERLRAFCPEAGGYVKAAVRAARSLDRQIQESLER